MLESSVLDAFVATLRSLGGLYPGGVPERYLRSSRRRFAFVHHGGLSSQEHQLAHAAIEKGMNISSKDVWMGNASELAGQLTADIMAVSLGREALRSLCQFKSSEDHEVVRGIPFRVGQMNVLLTHPLAEVLASAACKREFWNDLKVLKEWLSNEDLVG